MKQWVFDSNLPKWSAENLDAAYMFLNLIILWMVAVEGKGGGGSAQPVLHKQRSAGGSVFRSCTSSVKKSSAVVEFRSSDNHAVKV